MKWILKRALVLIWMISFLFAVTATQLLSAEKTASKTKEVQKASRHLVVMYFHNTFRCPTCHKIEELSNYAIHRNFEDQLKSGKLVWRVINVDEPENKHFIKDYQLYSKHLIVSEVKGGKEVRWKDLKKIWTKVGNDEKFENYVKTEIADWLKG